MKKAQISGQIIIYILSMVIFGGILIYGYSAIQGFTSDQERVAYIKFEEDFKNTIRGLLISYGDVEVFNDRNPLKLPTGFTEMCIIDLNEAAPETVTFSQTGNSFPLVQDSWASEVRTNVFLMQNDKLKETFFAGNITVKYTNKYLCFQINSGRVTDVMLEGVGAKAELERFIP
jgi:hypothetical protein